MMKKVIAFVLMSLISVTAMADSWKKLGERELPFGSGMQENTIFVSAFKGRYKEISLRVEDAPVFVEKITVFFGNGRKQELFLNKRYERNTQTRDFKLLDAPRTINKVTLRYRRANGIGNQYKAATVKLLGLRD